ncbi:MAG: hypothetical protein H6704_10965 [Myxococcales bacterium]|nr:hypothetical protein [Myxococcales bacterium]
MQTPLSDARRCVRAVLVGRDARDDAAERAATRGVDLEPLADVTLSGLPVHQADRRAELAVLLDEAREGLRLAVDALQARLFDPAEVALATVFAAAVRAAWARLQADDGDAAARSWWLARAAEADARHDAALTHLESGTRAAPDPAWASGELRTWRHRVQVARARLDGPIDFAALGLGDDAAWRAAGLSADAAGAWDAWGFEPTETVAWRCACLHDPDEAAAWRAAGFAAVDAVAWRDAGITPTAARAWRRAGFDLPLVQATRARDPEARPDDCVEGALLTWLRRGSVNLDVVRGEGVAPATRAVLGRFDARGRTAAVHALGRLADQLGRAAGPGAAARLAAALDLLGALPVSAPRLTARLRLARGEAGDAAAALDAVAGLDDVRATLLRARAHLQRADAGEAGRCWRPTPRPGRPSGAPSTTAIPPAGPRPARASVWPPRSGASRASPPRPTRPRRPCGTRCGRCAAISRRACGPRRVGCWAGCWCAARAPAAPRG